MSDFRVVPDLAWLVDRELEQLADMLRGGSPRVDYRRRFVELAQQIADWQGVALAVAVTRYGLALTADLGLEVDP